MFGESVAGGESATRDGRRRGERAGGGRQRGRLGAASLESGIGGRGVEREQERKRRTGFEG